MSTLPTVAITKDRKIFYCPRLDTGFLCGNCIHILLTKHEGSSTKCLESSKSCPKCHCKFEHQSARKYRPFRVPPPGTGGRKPYGRRYNAGPRDEAELLAAWEKAAEPGMPEENP